MLMAMLSSSKYIVSSLLSSFFSRAPSAGVPADINYIQFNLAAHQKGSSLQIRDKKSLSLKPTDLHLFPSILEGWAANYLLCKTLDLEDSGNAI